MNQPTKRCKEMSVPKKPPQKAKKKPATKKHTPTPNPVGRPPFFTDPEVMQAKMDEYFVICDKGEEIDVYDKKRQEVCKVTQKIPYTVPGLVYHLGFGDDHGLDYYKKKDKFLGTITRAWKRIERQRNEKALTGDQEPRFAQFDLSHNFRWAEKKELAITAPPGLKVSFDTDD